MIRVTVGRLDNSKVVSVSAESTIKEALRKGGYTIAENDEIQDLDNNVYESDDEVEAGCSYFLVERVKSSN